MSKRDKIYKEFSENGYPKDIDEKKEFSTRLFGAFLVGAMESVLEDKFKVIDGEDDSENLTFVEKLTIEEKIELKDLLASTCAESFRWQMVKIEQFPEKVDINLFELDEDENNLNKICEVSENMDLKFRYYDWISEFSDYLEE